MKINILPNFGTYTGLLILLPVLIFSTERVWAGNWQSVLASRFSTEFDSNPTRSSIPNDGAWQTIIVPDYTLIGNFGENELTSGLAYQLVRSTNQTLIQNRNSPTVHADWLHKTESGEFGISSQYAETSTRDSSIDSVGQNFTPGTRTARINSIRAKMELSERITLSANGSYEGVVYTGGSYVDYAARSFDSTLSYILNEYNATFVELLHTDFIPANGTPSSTLISYLLGWNWKISDSFDSTLQIGEAKVDGEVAGTQGAAKVQYTGQRTQLILKSNRQVRPSGLGDFVTADQTNINWSYALSENSKTGIDLGWSVNHLATETTVRSSGVWLQHDLNSLWSLKTYYMRNSYFGGITADADSYILGLSFIYSNTDF
jgi:hypothetical protein